MTLSLYIKIDINRPISSPDPCITPERGAYSLELEDKYFENPKLADKTLRKHKFRPETICGLTNILSFQSFIMWAKII